MNERDQGFPFAIEILGRFDLWPVSIEMDMPGDYRAGGWPTSKES